MLWYSTRLVFKTAAEADEAETALRAVQFEGKSLLDRVARPGLFSVLLEIDNRFTNASAAAAFVESLLDEKGLKPDHYTPLLRHSS